MSGSSPHIVITRQLPAAVEELAASRYHVTRNLTDTPYTTAQFAELLQTADVILCTVTDKVTADLFAGGVRTKLLANFGVGVNHIARDAARAAGIQISNTPDVLTDDTADIALALLLMTMRRMGEGERFLRRGAWTGWKPTDLVGRSPHGKTLGIIGYGRIGRALARQCAAALGMHILYYAPRDVRISDPATAGPAGAERVGTIEELLQRADVVSLNCPSTPETYRLMNAERFAMMKPTAFLVNTARGDVVHEAALVEALRTGVIAGAGIDVYEYEPKVDPGLLELENVVLLPHMGSGTVETRTAMGMRALANIDAFVAGQRLPDLVEF